MRADVSLIVFLFFVLASVCDSQSQSIGLKTIDTVAFSKFILPGFEILDTQIGNINLDQYTADAVLVLREIGEGDSSKANIEPGPRPLFVLLEQADGSRIAHLRTDSAIARNGSGGWFEPFEGIEIDSGSIEILHFGGLAWVSRRDRKFVWSDSLNTLRLDSISNTTVWRGDPEEEFHPSIWGGAEIDKSSLLQMHIDSEVPLKTVVTCVGSPHLQSVGVRSYWVKDLLDTSLSNITQESADLMRGYWSDRKTPEAEWANYFVALELPTNRSDGNLYIVQPSKEPFNGALTGAHAAFFWIVQDSAVDEPRRNVIKRVLISGIMDCVGVDLSEDKQYPVFTLVWLYADRIVEVVMKYNSDNNVYQKDAERTLLNEPR